MQKSIFLLATSYVDFLLGTWPSEEFCSGKILLAK